MTQNVQDIGYLKGQKVQDIGDPAHDLFNMISSRQQLPKGGIIWNKSLEKQLSNAI